MTEQVLGLAIRLVLFLVVFVAFAIGCASVQDPQPDNTPNCAETDTPGCHP